MLNQKGLKNYQSQQSAVSRQEGSLPPYTTVPSDLIGLIVDEIVASMQTLETVEPSACTSSDCQMPLIPVGISNRHIHITKETFAKLFGEETPFEMEKPLYQPGEFVSKHVVTVAGPKMRAIQGVRILGPLRNYDQVEVSYTEAVVLGIKPPVRNSGDLDDAVALTLIGPRGSVYIEKVAIVANRHIHMTSSEAAIFGVRDGEFCRVRVGGEKSTVYENVLVRVNDNWKLIIHLDTDDANAAYIGADAQVEFLGRMD